MSLIAALLLAATSAEHPLLVFKGNVTLVDDVYRSVLDLPRGARATPELAKDVGLRVRKFLHKAGYVLATVQTRVDGDQIVVELDEGHLDKIAFVGADVVQALRLKMDLRMPDKVLNQPDLERQLRFLSDHLHLAEFAYEIVPSPDFPQQGKSLDQMQELEELGLMPGFPYELHILVVPGAFHPGLSPQVEINSLEGGGLGLGYNGESLLQEKDRWHIEGRVAGGLRDRLDKNDPGSRPVFTHSNAELAWDGRPLFGNFRLAWRGAAEAINRQRGDVNLEQVIGATLTGSIDGKLALTKYIGITLGGGLERRFLFDAVVVPGLTPLVPTDSLAQTRPFAEAYASFVFNPEELRRDRKHTLDVYGRTYFGSNGTAAVRTDVRYQKLFALGWHELWLTGRGVWMSGDVLYTEEQSLGGEALRDVFAGTFVRKMAGAGAEFRWSLLRDVFKVGLWNNFAGYNEIDRLTLIGKKAWADSFGLGVHVLAADEFQLDLYWGVGFKNDGSFGSGASLQIAQAY